MEFKDYYATLGVTKTSSDKEIKQAFRKAARAHHPDVNPGNKQAEARFKEINEAYDVLGDPVKRKKYDELGANWKMYEQAAAQGGQQPFAGGWHADMGGGTGYRTMSAEEVNDLFGDEHPFSDFFTTFFGGGQQAGTAGRGPGRARRRQHPGRDVEHAIELTLEEAHNGTMRRLSLKHDGHARTVDVRIPPGVGDGSRVRVAGEGEQGVGGSPAGDLFLRVHLAPHPEFERTGQDLRRTVRLPVTTAVLGGEVEVRALTGRSVRLRVPPLTQNGQVFRLKGYGMPRLGHPGDTGDLYVRVEAQLPSTLSPEERAHYEALAREQGGTVSTHPAA